MPLDAKKSRPSIPRVFVSYSRGELNQYLFVKMLIARIAAQPLDPWDFESFDQEITAGSKIDQTCLEEIEKADIFIPIITDVSLESSYVQLEVHHALSWAKSTEEVLHIVPIIMTESRNWPPPFSDLRQVKCINASTDCHIENGIEELVEKTIVTLCHSQGIRYIPPDEDAPRLPLRRNLVLELEELGASDKTAKKRVNVGFIFGFCSDLAYEIKECDYDSALATANIIEKILKQKQYFPGYEFYYLKIVKAVIQTNLAEGNTDLLIYARTMFQQLIDDRHPKLDVNAYTGVGNIAMMTGDYDAAHEAYNEAIQLCPQDPVCFHNLLLAKLALKKSLDTKTIYQRVKSLESGIATQRPGDFKRIALILVYALIHCGDLQKAKVIWSRLGSIDADESDLVIAMVQRLFRIAEEKDDIRSMKTAQDFIEVFLTHTVSTPREVRNNLINTHGWIKSYLGDTPSACKIFEELANENSQHIRYLIDAAIMHLFEEKRERGKELLKNAIGIDFDVGTKLMMTKEFFYYKGLAHWLLGNDEVAKTFYDQSVNYGPYYNITNSWVPRIVKRKRYIIF